MIISLVYSQNYHAAHVSFEGAIDKSGSFNSSAFPGSPFWTAELDPADPCLIVVTGVFPWDEFRTSLGGLTETRVNGVVTYQTVLDFDGSINVPVVVNPGTPMVGTERFFSRTLRTKIPIEINFEVEIQLDSDIVVTRNETYFQSVLTESSILEVNPTADAFARAEIVVTTVTAAPFRFDGSPQVSVNVPGLSNELSIEEDVTKRVCDALEAFCFQSWRIEFYPQVCTLDGVFTVGLNAECHPGSSECVLPGPDVTSVEFELDVTSDDFCGFAQTFGIVGDLALDQTECNELMSGTVFVFSPEGGVINHTEITRLDTFPTLAGADFATIFNESDPLDSTTVLLNYTAQTIGGNQVDFSFVWEGALLRCNVFASVVAWVRVEFEATRPLAPALLSVALQQSLDDYRLDGTVRVGGPNDVANPITIVAAPAQNFLLQNVLIGVLAGVVGVLLIGLSVCLFKRRQQRKKAGRNTVDAVPTENSLSTIPTDDAPEVNTKA